MIDEIWLATLAARVMFVSLDTTTGYGSSPNQVEPGDASTDEVETSYIVRKDVLGGCGKGECAFHVVLAFGVFFSELHDKGQAVP